MTRTDFHHCFRPFLPASHRAWTTEPRRRHERSTGYYRDASSGDLAGIGRRGGGWGREGGVGGELFFIISVIIVAMITFTRHLHEDSSSVLVLD